MPYIKKTDRAYWNEYLDELLDSLGSATAGELNYIISKIIWTKFDDEKCYSQANMLMGVLESVKQEFYRRKVAPMEDSKIIENGDLDE